MRGRRIRGKNISALKVHKRENFFDADFGFLSKMSYPIIKWMFFTKHFF